MQQAVELYLRFRVIQQRNSENVEVGSAGNAERHVEQKPVCRTTYTANQTRHRTERQARAVRERRYARVCGVYASSCSHQR